MKNNNLTEALHEEMVKDTEVVRRELDTQKHQEDDKNFFMKVSYLNGMIDGMDAIAENGFEQQTVKVFKGIMELFGNVGDTLSFTAKAQELTAESFMATFEVIDRILDETGICPDGGCWDEDDDEDDDDFLDEIGAFDDVPKDVLLKIINPSCLGESPYAEVCSECGTVTIVDQEFTAPGESFECWGCDAEFSMEGDAIPVVYCEGANILAMPGENPGVCPVCGVPLDIEEPESEDKSPSDGDPVKKDTSPANDGGNTSNGVSAPSEG